jgi:FkbM family methyltransferase
MFHRLEKLKALGYIPDTILDIGACRGLWTYECKKLYPEAIYYLFEPIAYPELEQLRNNSSSTLIFHTLLDESERMVDWYEKRNTGDSMFREKTIHYNDCIPVKRRTTPLSTVIHPFLPSMKHVFLKIDCQGAEIPILKGVGEILSKTDFILLEIPFFGQYNENVPTFLEHIQFMDTIGYVPFDILEVHTIKNFSLQIDALFISKTHSFHQRVQEVLLE